jgi:hypothetical protein
MHITISNQAIQNCHPYPSALTPCTCSSLATTCTSCCSRSLRSSMCPTVLCLIPWCQCLETQKLRAVAAQLPGDEGWRHGECWRLWRGRRHGLSRRVKTPIGVAREGGGRWLRELASSVGRLRAWGCRGRRWHSRSWPTTSTNASSTVLDAAAVLNEAKEGR